MYSNQDYGARPFASARTGTITSKAGCSLLLFDENKLDELRLATPQLNYFLRKRRGLELNNEVEWSLGQVSILN